MAGHLIGKGIAFNGIILISAALDLRPIDFGVGDDLPYQLFVPTYAATAWYHGRLCQDFQRLTLPELTQLVRDWSETELATALIKGDMLPEDRLQKVAIQLASYTGLNPQYVMGTNLRIGNFRFCKELLRDEKRSVGRLDSRFKGIEALAVSDCPEFDPAMLAITPPYTAMFNAYLRCCLGIHTDMSYEVLNVNANELWEWDPGALPATGEVLRGAMAKNPFMNVFVGNGYFDLATPCCATEYMINHMNIDVSLRKNVHMKTYEAGHMFYLDLRSLARFKSDVGDFIRASH